MPSDPISPEPKTQSQIGKQYSMTLQESAETLPAGLYIVSTPIGNLRDITLRALDILAQIDHILAEDTRQSARLLGHYDIQTSLSAYHDHNAAKRIPKLIETLKEGQSLALISDAGTPLISDPGYKLVRAAIDADIKVTPIPGASAVLAALTLSGLPSDSFTFGGFLPAKKTARQKHLARYKTQGGTLMFFETGPRLAASLQDIIHVLGDRQGALTRELTKFYEEARYGHISEIAQSVQDDPPKGEIVLCIGPDDAKHIWDEAQIIAALPEEISLYGVKRASEYLATLSGWAKRDIYKLALKIKDDV